MKRKIQEDIDHDEVAPSLKAKLAPTWRYKAKSENWMNLYYYKFKNSHLYYHSKNNKYSALCIKLLARSDDAEVLIKLIHTVFI